MIKTAVPMAFMGLALLAGCMPVPQQAPLPAPALEPIAAAPPVQQPVPPTPATGISGLKTREPDLCGAKDYRQYQSQSASVIPTLDISEEYRVVEYRGIEPQDYNPNRIVFRLDSAGNINEIGCG